MVLNEKELSFKKKRPRRLLPGSAAESGVRPPNMGRFREHFWPPKAWFEGTKVRLPNLKFSCRTCMSLGGTLGCRRWFSRPPIKSPQIGNGRVFSPFSSSVLKLKKEFWEFGGFWGLDPPHLRVRDRTTPRSSRGKCRSLLS
ncbi:hypothetical protein MANES_10G013015v8 [Manihot esculenta]|uniref:Uncharacterized protein n=1 Tax=Manihot esculenta TaxID=3983 RepID=A0ACB7GY27_MANES|nr:hypothetical protein MANES_10G013015v8 [Manihot esculenta]